MSIFNIIPSLLFTPATKPDIFHKAYEAGAGGIILDLEDSVSAADKNAARQNLSNYLKSKPHFSRPFAKIVRINALSTLNGLQDILFLIQDKISCDGISIPKVNSHQELHLIAQLLKEGGIDVPLLAQIETQKGITHIEKIASRCSALKALCLGAADYCVDLGSIPLNWNSLLYARERMVVAAGMNKIGIYDSPFFNIPDLHGLKEETKKIKELGFTGKLAIHPSHIPIINQVFTPTEEEIDDAKNIISTFEEAKGNACQYKGRMIDVPVFKGAEKILERFHYYRKLQ